MKIKNTNIQTTYYESVEELKALPIGTVVHNGYGTEYVVIDGGLSTSYWEYFRCTRDYTWEEIAQHWKNDNEYYTSIETPLD